MEGVFSGAAWADRPLSSQHSADFKFLQACVGASRASSTFDRYKRPWGKFRSWCGAEFCSLPAAPQVVAAYLAHVMKYCIAHDYTFGVVKMASAAIYQAHQLAGLGSPTDAPIVKAMRECAARVLGLSKNNRKSPLELQLVYGIAQAYSSVGGSVERLQVAVFVMVCFFGFLRYSDSVAVFADEVKFYNTHAELFIAKRKNLQYREGDVVFISRAPEGQLCPVNLLQSLLLKAKLSGKHVPVFCYLNSGTQKGQDRGAWSYQVARSKLFEAIASVTGMDKLVIPLVFGTQSLRSGGATAVAACGVSEKDFQRHGYWKDPKSLKVYVEASLEHRLIPTRALYLR